MSSRAAVHSIDALRDLRVALALFSDDVLSALGAVDAEIKRTVQWLQHDRRAYWQDQVKRRRERVSAAKAEVFRRQLARTPEYTPAMSEQKELLRKSEASLREAEARVEVVKKWEPALQQAALEYHGATRRIKDLAGGDVPRAVASLERMILALEAYLSVAGPRADADPSPLASIAEAVLDEEPIDEGPADEGPEPGSDRAGPAV